MTNTELKSRIAELESEVTRLKLQLGTLDQKKYLLTRAARGSRKNFERVLANIPERKPLPGDEFPPSNNPLNAQNTSQNPWWDQIAGSFADSKSAQQAAWYGRQWRESHIDLDPSPELKRLRKEYKAILDKLKILGRFKTKQAAKEYAHREFTK